MSRFQGAAGLVAPIFVILWSTGFIGAKLGLPYIEPMTFLSIRFALVILALMLWVWLSQAPLLTKRQAWDAAIIGALIHGVYLGGVFQAIALGTEAGVSALIVGAQPLLTAAIARRYLNEKLIPLQWVGMAVGFAGVALVVYRKTEAGIGDWQGVLLCLISLIAISVASILQKTRAQDTPMRSGTLIQFCAAFLVTAVLAAIFETRQITWTGELIFALTWLVLILSLGAVTLLFILLRRGAASNVASLFFLVPGATAVFAWALFGEQLGWIEIVGVCATAIGVLMVNRPGFFSLRSRAR